MQIYQEQVQNVPPGKAQVTIIKLVGSLDGSTYKQVIESVEKACAAGTRDLLLDLSEMPFLSSAGLAVLHSIALLVRKERLSDLNDSQNYLSAVKSSAERSGGPEKHIKLLNPRPKVLNTLHQVEFDRIFEIFTDHEAALAAFG